MGKVVIGCIVVGFLAAVMSFFREGFELSIYGNQFFIIAFLIVIFIKLEKGE